MKYYEGNKDQKTVPSFTGFLTEEEVQYGASEGVSKMGNCKRRGASAEQENGVFARTGASADPFEIAHEQME